MLLIRQVTHGAPEDTVRHVGDLGNIQANGDGEATVNITDNIISLTGSNSILGRSIVVHSAEDDLGKGNTTLSLTTGNAGDRWSCGIIGIEYVAHWSKNIMFLMVAVVTSRRLQFAEDGCSLCIFFQKPSLLHAICITQ